MRGLPMGTRSRGFDLVSSLVSSRSILSRSLSELTATTNLASLGPSPPAPAADRCAWRWRSGSMAGSLRFSGDGAPKMASMRPRRSGLSVLSLLVLPRAWRWFVGGGCCTPARAGLGQTCETLTACDSSAARIGASWRDGSCESTLVKTYSTVTGGLDEQPMRNGTTAAMRMSRKHRWNANAVIAAAGGSC